MHEVVVAGDARLVEEGSSRIVCDLGTSQPGPICLGLSLLREELTDELVLRSASGPWRLSLRVSQVPRDIRFRRCGNEQIVIIVGRIALETWLVFFLKYYRDGLADVDHLDMEGVWDTGHDCDLTLKVSLAKPPISAEEVRRRLGLDVS